MESKSCKSLFKVWMFR